MSREDVAKIVCSCKIARIAIQDKGGRIPESDIDLQYRDPLTAFAKFMTRAFAMDALKPYNTDLIAGLMGSTSEDILECERTLDLEQQGQAMLDYMHFRPRNESVAEAAERLGVSQSRVYKMIEQGSLDAVKVKGKVRVFSESVNYMLRERGVDVPKIEDLPGPII